MASQKSTNYRKTSKKQNVSEETKKEALNVAKGIQKPGQTKEQTKMIAQGIQKGIEQYKKQQKSKARDQDKLNKKRLKEIAEATNDAPVLEVKSFNPIAALAHVGRILIALYFLLPGIMKFVSWDMHIVLMNKHGMLMVPALLATAGVIQIFASLCLLANRWVVPVAIVLAGMVVVINICLHDFWNYTDIEGAHELQNFVKNLGIMGGLLVLAGLTAKQK